MSEKKKGIDGKSLLTSLEQCHTSREIFEVLHNTMDNDTLKERLGNLSDNDLVVALNKQRTIVNIRNNPQYYTTHQDAVTLAAAKYIEVTKGSVKDFKTEAKKEIAQKEAKNMVSQMPIYMKNLQR